jgi:hypothetical protein
VKKLEGEVELVEDPGVSTVEWDEGSSCPLGVVTTGSIVGACKDAPAERVEWVKPVVEAPTFGARVEDDG